MLILEKRVILRIRHLAEYLVSDSRFDLTFNESQKEALFSPTSGLIVVSAWRISLKWASCNNYQKAQNASRLSSSARLLKVQRAFSYLEFMVNDRVKYVEKRCKNGRKWMKNGWKFSKHQQELFFRCVMKMSTKKYPDL